MKTGLSLSSGRVPGYRLRSQDIYRQWQHTLSVLSENGRHNWRTRDLWQTAMGAVDDYLAETPRVEIVDVWLKPERIASDEHLWCLEGTDTSTWLYLHEGNPARNALYTVKMQYADPDFKFEPTADVDLSLTRPISDAVRARFPTLAGMAIGYLDVLDRMFVAYTGREQTAAVFQLVKMEYDANDGLLFELHRPGWLLTFTIDAVAIWRRQDNLTVIQTKLFTGVL